MQSRPALRTEPKASLWPTAVAFAAAAFGLAQGRAGVPCVLALGLGFCLAFARLRQELVAGDVRRGLHDELGRARELLSRGAYRQALGVAHGVAGPARSARMQREALELVAWAELGLGRPQAARDALSWVVGSGAVDPYCHAAVEDACGQGSWALHLLERAAKRQELSREATLFRIDLHARLRGIEAACALTQTQLSRLQPEDAERVLRFASAAGYTKAASALGLAIARVHPGPGARWRLAESALATSRSLEKNTVGR